ncbi:1627_t:CDS:2, partial [Rhizophagus irregularis]
SSSIAISPLNEHLLYQEKAFLEGNSGYCIKDSYKKQIRGPSSESVLHYGVFCDYYCKPKSHIHRHPNDHAFKLIPHSESAESAPQFAVHYGIVCKSCNKKIHGMRWNCTFCNNYNLCQDCKFKSPNIDKHPNNHAFRPIAYSDSISVFLNRFGLIENAICDYCESECISGRCHKLKKLLYYIKAVETHDVL